ncbi:MAG TPA: sugar transferase, partial [Gemmataceae bacterium]|nr:sugar transferase [Gemmataceae bacterium]
MPVLPSRAPLETAPRPQRPVLRPFPAAPRHLAPPTPRPRRLPWKRALDLAAALALLVLAAPVVLAAAVLVRLTSKGPAFYSQTRLGRGGRPFTIWKLRTMV